METDSKKTVQEGGTDKKEDGKKALDKKELDEIMAFLQKNPPKKRLTSEDVCNTVLQAMADRVD